MFDTEKLKQQLQPREDSQVEEKPTEVPTPSSTEQPRASTPKRRIGIDTGGTFTDFVWLEAGQLRIFKLPSTPEQPSSAVTFNILRRTPFSIAATATKPHLTFLRIFRLSRRLSGTS